MERVDSGGGDWLGLVLLIAIGGAVMLPVIVNIVELMP